MKGPLHGQYRVETRNLVRGKRVYGKECRR